MLCGFLLSTLLLGCKSKPKKPAPIEECVQYADKMSACFGRETGEAAHRELDEPEEEASRERQRSACAEQLERLRRTCR